MLFDQAIAAVVGAVIGATASLTTRVITSRNERQRWERDKLFESYSNCIYYLVKLSMSAVEQARSEKDVRQHIAECQRYLNILSLYDEKQDRLLAAREQIEENWNKASELADAADRALGMVKSQFGQDTRLLRRSVQKS